MQTAEVSHDSASNQASLGKKTFPSPFLRNRRATQEIAPVHEQIQIVSPSKLNPKQAVQKTIFNDRLANKKKQLKVANNRNIIKDMHISPSVSTLVPNDN